MASITGNQQLDLITQIIEQAMQQYRQAGLKFPKDIKITPAITAQFLKEIEKDLGAEFGPRAQLARQNWLTSIGWTKGDVENFEKQAEIDYNKGVRLIGTESAETGFARSGIRKRGEGELTEQTAEKIRGARETATQQMQTQARQFYSQWGGLPWGKYGPQTDWERQLMYWGGAPTMTAGQYGFTPGTQEMQWRAWAPASIYKTLKGEQYWQKQAEKETRLAQMQAGWLRTALAKRYRKLVFGY